MPWFANCVLLGESLGFDGYAGMVFSGVLANQINRVVAVLTLLSSWICSPFGFEFPEQIKKSVGCGDLFYFFPFSSQFT